MEPLRLNYTVDGSDYTSAGEASADVKRVLKQLGLPPAVIRKVSICMYEGEINMVIHGGGGIAGVSVSEDAVTIVLADQGPGIADIDQAMQEGWSTASETARDLGFGAGMGLPNMKKYSDEMTIDSVVGQGTTLKMIVYAQSPKP